jgi:hypothetical protein
MIINIKAISKVLENSASGRKVFKFAINTILYILEQQRLVDFRSLQKLQLDWDKGTIKLGDNFMEMLVGRSIGEYVINAKRNKIRTLTQERIRSEQRGIGN